MDGLYIPLGLLFWLCLQQKTHLHKQAMVSSEMFSKSTGPPAGPLFLLIKDSFLTRHTPHPEVSLAGKHLEEGEWR
jgi:hypothetical protein